MSCSKALHLPKVTSVMRPMDYTRLPGLNCCCKGMRKDLVKERVRLVWQEEVPDPGADGLWVRFFCYRLKGYGCHMAAMIIGLIERISEMI